jgi:hypothetical protein
MLLISMVIFFATPED